MSDRSPAGADAGMQFGLLMESAQAHQRLAEGQLEKLRAHTEDLDGVVRDEIRRTLIEELQMLTLETTRATRALQRIRQGVGVRSAVLMLMVALLGAVVPLAVCRWMLPSVAELRELRAQRDALSANIARLRLEGGRIDLRHCGETQRLCVRVDLKASAFGPKADYYVLAGY
jgi:hypothetical protein